MQKEGYKGLTGLGREKSCKKNGGKRQKKLIEALTESYRERVLKTFWKVSLSTWKSDLKNSLYDFRLIEN